METCLSQRGNAKRLMKAEMGMYPMDMVAEALEVLAAGWGVKVLHCPPC